MKTYVRTDWIARNEYTKPILESPVYRNSGIIKAVTEENEKIQVGKITYEEFENEEFQYIITPFWPIIDTLSAKVFQGIPGIDMELRLEHYYRVNYVPVFITERTPGPSREDLWELLESVGLDYYDRLEWLIRTDLRAAIDNLIVERARDEMRTQEIQNSTILRQALEDGQYGDEFIIESIATLGTNSKECVKRLNRMMHYGIQLTSKKEKLHLCVEDYQAWMPIFEHLCEMDESQRKKQQQKGIQQAKKLGIYKGRKRKEVDEQFLKEQIRRFQKKEISLEEALQAVGMSKSTLYRRMRETEND